MMPVINDGMLAISSSLAASIIVKATFTLALGLTGVWLARKRRAAARHALLAAIFGVILLLPIGAVVMPALQFSVPVEVESGAAPPFLATALEAGPSAVTMEATPRVPLVALQASKHSYRDLLIAGWAAGAALFLLPVVIGLWQIRSVRRSALPWGRGQSVVAALALDAGIHRRVEVLLHEELPGPMTCGVVHPVIILPCDAENWNREDLNRAMVHELEHIRRGDSLSRFLARVASAVYWFHPLVWIAWRKLVLEAERSCDDAVLGQSEATAYADQLVGLAKRLSTTQRSPLLAMANRADLAARIGALLDSRQRRGRAGTLSLALGSAAAAALVLVMSPLMVVAAPQSQPPKQTNTPHDAQAQSPLLAQAQVPAQAQAQPRAPGPAQVLPAPTPAASDRLLAMFFDLNSVDAETVARFRDSAMKFLENQATSADRISVITYDSKLNVLQDFTSNHGAVLAALRTIMPADAGNNGAGNGIAGPEFDIFTADRRLAAIEQVVKLLGAVPEKKAMLYFSTGATRNGIDNQAQLQATINAAIRGKTSPFSPSMREEFCTTRHNSAPSACGGDYILAVLLADPLWKYGVWKYGIDGD